MTEGTRRNNTQRLTDLVDVREEGERSTHEAWSFWLEQQGSAVRVDGRDSKRSEFEREGDESSSDTLNFRCLLNIRQAST